MTAIDRQELEARVGPKADYYLRRFEQIDSGRRVGWNWPAFFLSTAWFAYRGLSAYALLNLVAPWATLISVVLSDSEILTMLLLIGYPVVLFLLVPMYADALYYRRVRREIARAPASGGKPASPTRSVDATVAGIVSLLSWAMIILAPANMGYASRSQVSEAVSLLAGAKTPIAEYFADFGKWPTDIKLVAGNTSGRYTERVEITSGAGGAGPVVITATMKASGVHSSLAGKTVQVSSADGKTWTCSRGTVNGVDDKYLPAACRP